MDLEQGDIAMKKAKQEIEVKTLEAWKNYFNTLEHSLKQMELSIEDSVSVPAACTNEWCETVEHVIDELTQAIFTLNIPKWATKEQVKSVEDLKKKAQKVYAKYLQASA